MIVVVYFATSVLYCAVTDFLKESIFETQFTNNDFYQHQHFHQAIQEKKTKNFKTMNFKKTESFFFLFKKDMVDQFPLSHQLLCFKA